MKNNSPVVTIPFRIKTGEIVDRAQFSLQEASEIAGPPVSQFRKLGKEGAFNPITGFGRKWYISAEDLLRLFNHRLRNNSEAVNSQAEPA